MYHMGHDLDFTRDGDAVFIEVRSGTYHFSVSQFASCIAAMSRRGETGEVFKEALALLNAEAS